MIFKDLESEEKEPFTLGPGTFFQIYLYVMNIVGLKVLKRVDFQNVSK